MSGVHAFPSRWRFAGALFGGLSALIVVVYWHALFAWFAADDFRWLEISNLESVLQSFVGPWGHGPAYRPLSRVSFGLDRTLFGLEAGPWHAHSLLLLALCATLLGVLIDRVAGDRLLAVSTAAVFAVLPTNYENAIWISGRIHLIGMAFSLLALLAFDRFLTGDRARDAIIALIAYALGLASYEASLYVVPGAVLLALLRRRGAGARPTRALLWIGAAVALTGGYAGARLALIGSGTLYPMRALAEVPTADFLAHLGNAARKLVRVVDPVWLPLAVAGVVAGIAAPRTLAVAALGGVVAAIGFAPFALAATPPSPRFIFASGVGLALALGAIVAGLARVPRAGEPLALTLLAVLLAVESRDTRHIAWEWRNNGALAQRVLAAIVATSPAPAESNVVVVFGVPQVRQRAMLFNTYFETAMRVFHPSYGRFALPAEEFDPNAETKQLDRLASFWEEDAARRVAAGRGPVPCGAARAALRVSVESFLDELIACDALFVEVDANTQVGRRVDPQAARRTLRDPASFAPPARRKVNR